MALSSSPVSCASVLSSSASCSSLSSSSGSSTHSSCSLPDLSPRPNEHLAVLLAKHLWKPDSSAPNCDNFYCRTPFSLLDRRHHCRKCGGVFCGPCSARTTSLLDASALPFLHPPRGTPLAAFESPVSPIVSARVCDDCYDQIHGVRSPVLPPPIRRPAPPSRANSLLSSPIALFRSPASSISSSASAPASAASSPPAPTSPSLPPLSHSTILPAGGISLSRAGSRCRTRPSSPRSLRAATLPAEEPSYGELDAYPLRRASLLCKASGGGRWEPKPDLVDPALRVPIIGGKAPYEIDMEREEEEERQRRRNPVIRDGEFQYRFPSMCEPEPIIIERPSLQLSTF